MIIVELADPRSPPVTALLEQSHALMQDLFPPEENSFLQIDQLCADNISFFAARLEQDIVGTAALAKKRDYGELKSMFVATHARGMGVADALLRQVEDSAREQNLPLLTLETGDLLHAAIRLYQRHGFAPRGPFGDYVENGSSVFMEKPL